MSMSCMTLIMISLFLPYLSQPEFMFDESTTACSSPLKEFLFPGTRHWVGLSYSSDRYVWHNGIDFSVTQANIGQTVKGAVSSENEVVIRQHEENSFDLASTYKTNTRSVICQGNLDEIDITADLS